MKVLKAPTTKLWDKIWFNDNSFSYHESVIDQVKKLKSVSTILEIGAGSGADLLELKKLGYRVTFSDFSDVAIKNINKRAPQLKTVKCDARHLPFKKNSFDLIFCLGLLEHFNISDRKKIIKEMFRISNKYILIDVPQKYSFSTIIKKILMAMKKWEYGDETEFSYFELLYEVNQIGLNFNNFSHYGRELISLPRNFKNKLYLKLPLKLRRCYLKLLQYFYWGFTGSFGIIFKKIDLR